ncbi:type VII secretion target [Kitasatospora indigofera]|uniref:type VII secretion target n=1 Tax=Kitasatospora indigofera TaxID=67307 RepID=UPI0036914012
MADFQVDPEALKLTAKGINDAIGELKKVGIAEGAVVGRGFTDLELTGGQIGSPGCKSAFDEFCERWGVMVRGLVQQGNEIAEKLDLSAGIYHDHEQYVSGALKDAVSAAMGNPNLTQDQVEGRSWGQTLSDNPYTQVRDADYSAKSFEEGALHSAATWKGVEADLLEHNIMLNQVGDEEWNKEHAAKAKAMSDALNQRFDAYTQQQAGGR